jgi:hypothetical protein
MIILCKPETLHHPVENKLGANILRVNKTNLIEFSFFSVLCKMYLRGKKLKVDTS